MTKIVDKSPIPGKKKKKLLLEIAKKEIKKLEHF